MKYGLGMLLEKTAIGLILVSGLIGCSAKKLSPLTQPAYDQVAVQPIVIHPQLMVGAAERLDASTVIKLLSSEATKSAQEVVMRQRIANSAVLANSDQQPKVILSLSIAVPISFPEGVRGTSASMRDGVLAGATLSLKARGEIERLSVCTINWDNLWWTTGGHRRRKARPVDDVLIEAIQKTVESCVLELQRQFLNEN